VTPTPDGGALTPATVGGPLPIVGPYATQPYNRVVWPSQVDTGTWPIVYDVASARRVPAVNRAITLYGGMIKQCPLDDYRGITPLPRPRVLEQPDPDRGRPWFVQVLVEDYIEHGNAVAMVTARDAAGWPAALTWIPAQWLAMVWDPAHPADLTYCLSWDPARALPARDLIHVRRGADKFCPARGVGVVEEMCRTFDRVAREEEYERAVLSGAAVPSVAIITPNPRLGEEEATAAKTTWVEKYAGYGRQPGVFPAGTQVVPLSFSPADAQLTQARQASLVDVANSFNLDPYWLGAPSSSHTYRSPGPMYLNLLRVSLEPVMTDFESVWSAAIVPRGRQVVLDRQALLGDDLSTTIAALGMAVDKGLWTRDEVRVYLRKPVFGDAVAQVGPLPPAGPDPADPPPADPADTDPDTPLEEDGAP
jgi:HK97 family phage portal protein